MGVPKGQSSLIHLKEQVGIQRGTEPSWALSRSWCQADLRLFTLPASKQEGDCNQIRPGGRGHWE